MPHRASAGRWASTAVLVCRLALSSTMTRGAGAHGNDFRQAMQSSPVRVRSKVRTLGQEKEGR